MLDSESATARGFDVLIFSGSWPASVAAALVALCGQTLSTGMAPVPWGPMALAAAGTLLVYNVDRLRDRARDRGSSPARTAFVERNRVRLIFLCGLAALASALLAACQPPLTWILLATAFSLGIFHRRLKGHPTYGIVYVAAAWVVVVVGLPAVGQPAGTFSSERLFWLALVLGAVIAANLIGSELRERSPDEETAKRLRTARVWALAGVVLAAAGPLHLALLPAALANLLALLLFRYDERYGLGVLDGALLAGALIGIGLS